MEKETETKSEWFCHNCKRRSIKIDKDNITIAVRCGCGYNMEKQE